MVRQLAYEIIAAVLRGKSGVVSPEETELMRNARKWLARADEVGTNQIMPADEMCQFEAWLDLLSQPNASDRDPPPRTEMQAFNEWFAARSILSKVRCEMPTIFSRAIKHVIGVLGGSPASAALIPTDFYDAVETDFLLLWGKKLRPPDAWLYTGDTVRDACRRRHALPAPSGERPRRRDDVRRRWRSRVLDQT
jgi:hypothetical protein